MEKANLSQTTCKFKGMSAVVVLLLILLTAVVFTGVGIVVSKYVIPEKGSQTDQTDVGKVEDDHMMEFISDKYGFSFTYPDTWQVLENGGEPTHRGEIDVIKGDYKISFKIMTYPGMQDEFGWGPEACIYTDTIVNLDDYIAVGYIQYEDYKQIDNGKGSFRRSQIEDSGLWIVCSAGVENPDNIYSTDSFQPIDSEKAQDRNPLTGFIEYNTPTLDISEATLLEMDLILQSAKMNQ
jgi:Na+-transporting methylmalonyl-CoA/oxaloacetate decarboxylase gamma subunit